MAGYADSFANAIDDAGQVVGVSELAQGGQVATEWSGGSVIDLGPGVSFGINNKGQAVGFTIVGGVGSLPNGATAA